MKIKDKKTANGKVTGHRGLAGNQNLKHHESRTAEDGR